jgi:serine/threonine-protein kinase
MTQLDDHRLLELARAIDDELPIDWHAAEGSMPDAAGRAVILELQVLESMARVARDPEGALTTSTATHPSAPLPVAAPSSQWGPLTLLEPIGGGAFGSVYRARDNLRHEIALKLFRDAPASRRFLREGRLLARVRHPNVVIVHGAGEHNGQVGLWMELIRGRTLEQELKARGPFSSDEARLIGLDLCRALAAVHEAGLVHRDVKAQNVMRERGGRIVLMDFGAGTEALTGDDAVRDIAGTPMYLPPEAFEGRPASRQWDIYSLGVLLYHLVTGSYPVSGSSRVEIQRAHAEGRIRFLRDARPDLPEEFVRVVELAFDSDPRRRYQTAGELERALLSPGGPGPAPVPPRRYKWQWRAVWALSAVAAVSLATPAFRHSIFGNGPAHSEPQRTEEPAAPLSSRAAARYTVGGAFFRYSNGQRVRVGSGDRVSPGDALGFQVEASIPVFVYVVNEDDHGEAYLLFPLPGQEAVNPLSGGTAHELPGSRDGQNVHWQVTSAGGREHFIVFVSPSHMSVFDELTALAHPAVGRRIAEPRLPESTVRRLRGVGGLTSQPSSRTSSFQYLFEGADPLGTGTDSAHGLWVRRLTLNNPGS